MREVPAQCGMSAHAVPAVPRQPVRRLHRIGMPILLVLVIGFGSRLLSTRFRYFSYATILAMLVFGLVQGLQASAMLANQPTPWMGVEERVTAYAPMLWFVVLAFGLLRAQVERPAAAPGSPTIAPTARPLTPGVQSGA